MKVLLQRVNSAEVLVDNKSVGKINKGLLLFLGISSEDSEEKIEPLVNKILEMRLFPNQDKKFDLSLKEVGGEVLVVSQFTLYANYDKGRRPDFFAAADPKKAEHLYNLFIEKLKEKGMKVESGEFAAYMKVKLENDGPVTFLIER